MKIRKTTDVFTPNVAADLTFVDRPEINDQLVDAIRTPGLQVLIYGDYGVGKSSLMIKKLNQLYEHHITTVCTASTTFDTICHSAFDQLDSFYLAETQHKDSSKASGGLKGVLLSFGLEKADEDVAKFVRSTPQLLDPANLSRLLGELNACWFMEDIHRLTSRDRDNLASCLKTMTDSADTYRFAKLVMTSNKDLKFWARYPDLAHRVALLPLGLMSDAQIAQIIDIGCGLLNVRINASRKAEIVDEAKGQPRIAHKLCLRLCQKSGINQTLNEPVELE